MNQPKNSKKPETLKLVASLFLIAMGIAYMLRNQNIWVIAAAIGGAVAIVIFLLAMKLAKIRQEQERD